AAERPSCNCGSARARCRARRSRALDDPSWALRRSIVLLRLTGRQGGYTGNARKRSRDIWRCHTICDSAADSWLEIIDSKRRDVRVVEGARLESVCRGNSTEGSNPSLSANCKLL